LRARRAPSRRRGSIGRFDATPRARASDRRDVTRVAASRAATRDRRDLGRRAIKTRNRSRDGRARAIDYGFCRARTWRAFERSYEYARGFKKKRSVARGGPGAHMGFIRAFLRIRTWIDKKKTVGRAPKKRSVARRRHARARATAASRAGSIRTTRVRTFARSRVRGASFFKRRP